MLSNPGAKVTLGTLFAVNAVSLDGPIVAIPAIANHFEVTSGQSQLILALFLLGYALGHIPSGLLGDRYGRRPVILTGMALATLLGFLAVIAPSLDLLLFARFGQGMCAATAGLLAKAIIRDVASGAEASRLSSNALSYVAVLIIIAPLLSSLLLALYDWRAVLGLVFFYFFTVTALTAIFIPETLKQDVSQAKTSPWQRFKNSAVAFAKSPQSYSASFYGGVLFSSYFVFSTSGASVIVDVYDLPASYFGPIFAVTAAAQFAALLINQKFVAQFGVFKMMTVAISISFFAVAIIATSLITETMPLLVFLAIGIALAVSHGMTLPNSIVVTLDPLPKTAGFAASIHGMFQTGIAALVGIFVSNLYDGSASNILTLFLIFALLNCAAFIALSFVRHRVGF